MSTFDENREESPDSETQVDLGDDLLEKTATLTTANPLPFSQPVEQPEEEESVPSLPRSEIDDQLESAKILLNEGLIDEAKKTLRRILIADPHHLVAKRKLEAIHDQELKQILSETEAPRPSRRKDRRAYSRLAVPERIDSEGLMRRLDQDLGLGVIAEESAEISLASQLSLFQDKAELERFARKLERDMEGSSAQDRIDIGIAFLEMGLYVVAERQFKSVVAEEGHALVGTSLLALCLILSGKALDATACLEPLIHDMDSDAAEKVELMYLMGRAFEQLRRPDEACAWFRQVLKVQPSYRDASDRIQRLAMG